MGTTGTTRSLRWSAAIALGLLALCHGSDGSHGSRARPGAAASVLRPLVLLEAEQGLPQGLPQSLPGADDAALAELDQLLNLLQAKGKRSQDLADKGLTRDLVTQVLQPGSSTGMWFGPRLGRRRRRSVTPTPSAATAGMGRRRRRSTQLQDGDVDNAIPWKLAELLREMQGPKRSPTPCDPSEINCLLANLANTASGYASSEEQRPRSEGNLVGFTPRLGRESGEQGDDAAAADEGEKFVAAASSRQLRTEGEPVWGFSPRLGRRMLPAGTIDVHAPADMPPRSRAARSAGADTAGSGGAKAAGGGGGAQQ